MSQMARSHLDMCPKVRKTKPKINYWDHIKIKSFCTAKETINKTKMQPTEWENMFANDLIKGQVPKYIKNFYNSTPKKQSD